MFTEMLKIIQVKPIILDKFNFGKVHIQNLKCFIVTILQYVRALGIVNFIHTAKLVSK